MNLRLGTRGSDLAIAQSRRIAEQLADRGHSVDLVPVKTEGDRDQARPFAELGPAGLFVRALEEALLEERIDFAVHSYKDLPSLSPEGLVIAAMPERMDVRDRLLVRRDAVEGLEDSDRAWLPLREGASVGTAAARRTALLADLRPDLEVRLLRGNVPTRVDKLRQGQYDAILLATAGLQRLDAAAALGQIEPLDRSEFQEIDLDPVRFVPAPSQGALALQVRADDTDARAAIGALDRRDAHLAVQVERELLARVEGGCQVAFGAWCEQRESAWHLHAYLERDGEHRRFAEFRTRRENLVPDAAAALLGESAR